MIRYVEGQVELLSAVTGKAEARDRVIYVEIRCFYVNVLVLVNVNVPECVGFFIPGTFMLDFALRPEEGVMSSQEPC
jgi:hypothetical protein